MTEFNKLEEDILKDFKRKHGKNLISLRSKQYEAVQLLAPYEDGIPLEVAHAKFTVDLNITRKTGSVKCIEFSLHQEPEWAQRIIKQKLLEAAVEIQSLARTIVAYEISDLMED